MTKGEKERRKSSLIINENTHGDMGRIRQGKGGKSKSLDAK